jgi:hypothetical protein
MHGQPFVAVLQGKRPVVGGLALLLVAHRRPVLVHYRAGITGELALDLRPLLGEELRRAVELHRGVGLGLRPPARLVVGLESHEDDEGEQYRERRSDHAV